jgi:hypothetical protein
MQMDNVTPASDSGSTDAGTAGDSAGGLSGVLMDEAKQMLGGQAGNLMNQAEQALGGQDAGGLLNKAEGVLGELGGSTDRSQ